MNGLDNTKTTLPPEVCKLIFDHLDDLSLSSVIDYINLLCDGNDSVLNHLIKDRLCFINIDKNSDFSSIPVLDELSESIYDGEIVVKKSIKRIIFILGPEANCEDIDWNNLIIEDKIKEMSYDIMYCGPPEIQTKDNGNISVLQKIMTNLHCIPIITELKFTKHIIIEFDLKDHSVYAGKTLFGALDDDFSKYYNGSDCIQVQQISFPNLQKLELHYMALDSFIYQAFTLGKLQAHAITYSIPTPQTMLYDFVYKITFFYPKLEKVTFLKKSSTQSSTETGNFIDVSSGILEKFKNYKVNLRLLFQIHSLKNWKMPNIKDHSGHRFKYDGITAYQQNTELIKTNIELLNELVLEQTKDATTYFRVNLIPEGVEKTRIINWAPLEITKMSVARNKSPLLFLNCKSLKELQLKPIFISACKKLTIQGLYLPNLELLTFYNDVKPESNSSAYVGKESSPDFEVQDMVPVEFSSWNDLPECEEIRFLPEKDPNSTNYIFDIKNLKHYLPKISLSKSFPNFIDERQKFVAV
ncbi:hypothetical protein Kpol_1035p5 [Vanderwaltozyma polyspora DSM 70294]|uniref:Uncharacterized protein n=1 Tax=Vanderwaltozyma polyspora (strain ATCC 22028 / DSM 70294 / BCRC 21397 / CBS 2163 / NBRC 10782 / NRRL Y-8283 / UCD 57-17) TaxID=436907 RepID=A7TKH1_VANPO|nr:uncharacterized protein Kpol_1035p5 [Vanderwaltozyma polyspora DSM 70294]EDO17193.1 hypothetical protein Kpol_1035p5 [Vanderwaltozyma polyspora DSM 70294]